MALSSLTLDHAEDTVLRGLLAPGILGWIILDCEGPAHAWQGV